jgi:hypothetical protein
MALNTSLTLPQFGKQYSPGEKLHPNVTPGVVGIKPTAQVSVPTLKVNLATAPNMASLSDTWVDPSGNVQGGAAPDPYAAWGGAAAYNKLVTGYDDQIGNVNSSVDDASRMTGINLKNSVLDFLDSMRVGQQALDNRGINNDLAKIRGTADVYGSVNRGINSGGVLLANKNANDSSAAGAIARAHGQIGQRQLSAIGNQYELENGEIVQAQSGLNMQEAAGVRRIQGTKEQAVTGIVTDAADKLAAIDAAMAGANLPDKIALDQEKNRIRAQVLKDLATYDAQLTGGLGKINPMDRNGRLSEATRRNTLGAVSPLQFEYDTEAPVEFQGDAETSQLPIYSTKYREE